MRSLNGAEHARMNLPFRKAASKLVQKSGVDSGPSKPSWTVFSWSHSKWNYFQGFLKELRPFIKDVHAFSVYFMRGCRIKTAQHLSRKYWTLCASPFFFLLSPARLYICKPLHHGEGDTCVSHCRFHKQFKCFAFFFSSWSSHFEVWNALLYSRQQGSIHTVTLKQKCVCGGGTSIGIHHDINMINA